MKNRQLILIRHGESTGNVDHSFYKLPDCCVALTPTGILQSVECAKKLLNLNNFNLWHHGLTVFSSNMYRAQQTAHIVLRCAGLRHVQPIITPSLHERYDDEESYAETMDRVKVWWEKNDYLLEAGDVMIFSHAFLIAAFMEVLMPQVPPTIIPNAEMRILTKDCDGKYNQV